MSKESGRRIDLLHADALESEKRNQLAMIEGQQFVDPAKDTTTGEMKVKSNQIWSDIFWKMSDIWVGHF